MTAPLILLLFLIGVALSWLFSGAETGFYLFSRLRLQLGLKQREAAAARLEHLITKPAILLSALLVGNNLALELVAFSSQLFLEQITALKPEAVASVGAVVTTPIIFLLCEAFPKNAFMTRPYFLLARVSALLRVLAFLLWPIATSVAWFGRRVGVWLRDRNSEWDAPRTKAGVLPALTLGLREGYLSRTEHLLAANVLRMGQVRVEGISVTPALLPRLSLPADPKAWADGLKHEEDSRALVYSEQGDRIVGVVHAVDVAIAIKQQTALKNTIRGLAEVSPRMPAGDMLAQMAEEGVPLALTRSGPRAAAQLIRLQDVVEEVVGRIRRV